MIGSLYKALGLTTSASIEEIKKAYRQLAKEYHPDKNKDGAEKFKEISHAYSILIDPEKKREYISKTATQSENFRGQRGFSAHEFTAHGFAGFSGFEHFFRTSAFERDPSPPKKTPEDYDIRTTCKVTLEEIYNGLPVRANYKEYRECLTCHGNPKQSTLKRSEKCKHCNGKGRIDRVVNQKATASSRCHFCKGQGYKSFYASCKECQNEPLVNKKVGVRVPKGVHDGHSLQLRNRGNLFPDKKTRGALLIRIQEEPHLIFTRQGDHLYINVKLTLKEAIMGFKNKVICTHLDGRMLTATQPTGQVIKPGSKRLIKGEGMPIFNSQTGVCGDLLVTFQVEFPDTVRVPSTREARLAIDALFETEEEIQARENAIVIDDEDETKESGATKEDNNSPPITIPDDDNVMKEASGAESNAASIPEYDQEHYIISDGEEAQQSAHENSNQEDSDEFFSDEDDFPHLFNVFL